MTTVNTICFGEIEVIEPAETPLGEITSLIEDDARIVILKSRIADSGAVFIHEEDLTSQTRPDWAALALELSNTSYFSEIHARCQTPLSAAARLGRAVHNVYARSSFVVIDLQLVGARQLLAALGAKNIPASGLVILTTPEVLVLRDKKFTERQQALPKHVKRAISLDVQTRLSGIIDAPAPSGNPAHTEKMGVREQVLALAYQEFYSDVRDIRERATITAQDAAGTTAASIFKYFHVGANWQIEKYTNDVGYAWCGIFLTYVFKDIIPINARKHLMSCTRMSKIHALVGDSVNPLTTSTPLEAGDVCTVGSVGQYGDHLVLVTSVNQIAGTFTTIEGNSTGTFRDGTKGEGVVTRVRKISSIVCRYPLWRVESWR